MWLPKNVKDFRSEEEWEKADDFVHSVKDFYAEAPLVKGWGKVRRLRFGQHRIFLYIDRNKNVVWILSYYPREHAYSEGSKRTTLARLKGVVHAFLFTVLLGNFICFSFTFFFPLRTSTSARRVFVL
jgi:mRNA-degrading endonuclease RelE of RelBE toxin-antitoxin system